MGALLGLLGAIVPSLIGAMSGGKGSAQTNQPDTTPKPQWQGMRGTGAFSGASAGSQLQDPGSRQAYQDPNIRLAALDQFRQKLGV